MISSATKTKWTVTLIVVGTSFSSDLPHWTMTALKETFERALPRGLTVQKMTIKKHAPMPKIGPRLPGTKSAPKVR